MSGSSAMTALAAAFMRSRARLSFGFSKPYLLENLDNQTAQVSGLQYEKRVWLMVLPHLVKPRPSILTTIHVFGRRLSGCSKCLTYSNLELHISHKLSRETRGVLYLELAILSCLGAVTCSVKHSRLSLPDKNKEQRYRSSGENQPTGEPRRSSGPPGWRGTLIAWHPIQSIPREICR